MIKMLNIKKIPQKNITAEEISGNKVIIDNLNFNIKGSELVQCTKEWSQNMYFSPNSCIGFIVSGEGWFKQDDAYIEPKEGQMYLLTEKHTHSFGVKNGRPYKMYYCNFNEQNSFIDFFSLYDLPLCMTPRNIEYIEGLFEKLINNGKEGGLVALIEQKVALYSLICEYIKDSGANPKISSKNVALSTIWESVQYMHKHFSEKISNEQLAQITGYNREYFIRKFTRIMKCSPMKYLNQLRVKEAEQLLRSTSLTMNEIAFIVGFETQHYFSCVFKKAKGVTPIEYRKMYS